MNLLAQKIRSYDIFYTCYHASGSTKHLHRPKVKRRNEDSPRVTPQLQGKEKLVSQIK